MKMTFRLAVALVFTAATLGSPHLGEGFAARAARTLDIYFIDVEGGQSPSGQSLLVDTGFPGHEGAFQSQPGDARQARDANRIAAAVRDAALKRIDFLLITHFHADHDGGAPELAALVPIRTFIDHGTVPAEAEQTSRGTLDAFQRYAAVRARARHIEPKPGDRLPLTGLVATVVSSARATLTSALDGAGRANASCGAPRPPQEPHENPRSTGIVLQFGRFRFIDLGDLTAPRAGRRLLAAASWRPRCGRSRRLRRLAAARGRRQQRRHEGRRVRHVRGAAPRAGHRGRVAAPSVAQRRGAEFRRRSHRESRRDDELLDQVEREGRWIVRRDERAHGRQQRVRR
ncbi:MAG: hypothetical protein DMG00_21935 [Acidobacteria bacterium]|nr:MAG: hypothetical protein DMG00_21935 [Acidobacteriota bacterium]